MSKLCLATTTGSFIHHTMVRFVHSPTLPQEVPGDQSRDSGFAGRLWCSTLADLVQLECLSGARAVVSVTSGRRRGYLFFDGGNMCHAMTNDKVQEDAALEILSWQGGSFEQASAGQIEALWPDQDPIANNWQHLLLRAAQLADEALRRAELTPPMSVVRPLALAPAAAPPVTDVVRVSQAQEEPSFHEDTYRSFDGADIGSAVVLGANDEMIAARGRGPASLVSYLRRMADLMAIDLGAEGAVGVACLGGEEELLLATLEDGRCAAVVPQFRLTTEEAVSLLDDTKWLQTLSAELSEGHYGFWLES